MDKRNITRNIRSNQVVDGSPKLPTAEQILHGEIAINFAKEHETLSLKNDNDEIVAFELRSVSNLNEKLNKEIERAQTAEQVNATAIAQEVTDRNTAIDSAIDGLDKSETTASAENAHVTVKYSETNGIVSMNVTESDIASAQALADEITRAKGAEQTNATAIANEITRATNSENTIKETYLKNINVNGINGNFSDNVASLTVKGKDIVLTDNYAVTEYPSSFDNRASHVSAADTIDSAFHHVESTIKTLSEDVITNELTIANSINALAEASGLVSSNNEITYVKKAKPYYIAEAETLADAINLLDDRIKLIEGLIDTKIKKAIYDLIKANPTLVNPYESNTSNA